MSNYPNAASEIVEDITLYIPESWCNNPHNKLTASPPDERRSFASYTTRCSLTHSRSGNRVLKSTQPTPTGLSLPREEKGLSDNPTAISPETTAGRQSVSKPVQWGRVQEPYTCPPQLNDKLWNLVKPQAIKYSQIIFKNMIHEIHCGDPRGHRGPLRF